MKRFKRRRDRGLYRSRNGVIFGVCRGLADYFDFSAFWVRMVFVIILFISGIWPLAGIYILASLLMKPEPVRPIRSSDEQDFYDNYVHSKEGAVRRMKRRYDNIERRIRRMEDSVTAREFEWDRKMNA